MSRQDIYFSADVESDGPIPGSYSMVSFGFAVAGSFDGNRFERADPEAQTFYCELRPISDTYDPRALAVSGLEREHLVEQGEAPGIAMTRASAWVREVAGDRKPILVAYPLSFDWTFLYWYFVTFSESGSPFGFSGALDIKTMLAIKLDRPISDTRKGTIPSGLRSRRKHTHNALDDAMEQADLFANAFEMNRAK